MLRQREHLHLLGYRTLNHFLESVLGMIAELARVAVVRERHNHD